MFMVSEADAAAIRQAFDEGGELAAMAELRRLFPGVVEAEDARLCVRAVVGWTVLPPVTRRQGAKKRRSAAR
jgi:hypothetical protein